MKRNGQLKFDDRVKIELYLEDEIPVSVICKRLGVSKQTIYREIQRNSLIKNRSQLYGIKCANQGDCNHRDELNNPIKCSTFCKRYVQATCKKLKRFPFVCNKCEKKIHCRFKKVFYYAKYAQEVSNKKLHETRKGIRISQEEFEQINDIISPLITDKGQSLNHILTTHNEINVSERTIRNWINNGYTSAKNIDLPRKVAFKPSKNYVHRITKAPEVILGRSYRDYRIFIKEHPELLICQLDTVIGKLNDANKILTIHFPSIHFQFGILINSTEPSMVNSKLLELRNLIGLDLWKRIFPIILTDNGIEFNLLYQIENDDETGEHLSNVFYCNPYCSSQKGACERNHEFIRYIEPKYHSFDHLNQDKVNLIFSHINSVYRQSLNGIRPIDLAEAILGTNFLKTIGIKKIEPDNVNLTQSLTKNIKLK